MRSLDTREIVPATALDLVGLALAHAKSSGWEVAAAVVDPSGHLVAFSRSERARKTVGGFAIDKAYTAATLGKSSRAFFERAAEVPSLALGLASRERLLVWGGGVAIYEGETCIGGLGVSGAEEGEDIDCAATAIRGLGLDPR